MTTNDSFSFKKGWNQLPVSKVAEVREKIMKVLNLKCQTSFYPRLNGDYEPKISEARAIEAIFAEYGIREVWGE